MPEIFKVTIFGAKGRVMMSTLVAAWTLAKARAMAAEACFSVGGLRYELEG